MKQLDGGEQRNIPTLGLADLVKLFFNSAYSYRTFCNDVCL